MGLPQHPQLSLRVRAGARDASRRRARGEALVFIYISRCSCHGPERLTAGAPKCALVSRLIADAQIGDVCGYVVPLKSRLNSRLDEAPRRSVIMIGKWFVVVRVLAACRSAKYLTSSVNGCACYPRNAKASALQKLAKCVTIRIICT
jgi:hypothetical protein